MSASAGHGIVIFRYCSIADRALPLHRNSKNDMMVRHTKRLLFLILIWFVVLGDMWANEGDSVSLRPSFSVDYSGEIQSDFRRTKFASLLELGVVLPLSKHLDIEVSSVSFVTSATEPLVDNIQGYSNIDAETVPFALAVAGLSWHINDAHRLFAGIRRIDEDYFCSDGLSVFTGSSCGGFPTITTNFDIAAYPMASIGLHYDYVGEVFDVKSSIYNGVGHNAWSGRDNVFRFCPKSDGLFALAQLGVHKSKVDAYLGASLHYGEQCGIETSQLKVRPVVWTYAELDLGKGFSAIGAFSHAFSSNAVCRNFCGIGGSFEWRKMQLGVFSNYTRADEVDEWQTELTCNYSCTRVLSIQPALHYFNTGGQSHCVGMVRLSVRL